MSTAVASKTTKPPKSKQPTTKASKGKRSGSDEPSRSHGDDNNTQDERGDRNDGSKTPRSSGSPAGIQEEASAGVGEDETDDEQREAREDAGRSAAISAFLRAAPAGGRGADHPAMARSGGGGGARGERKRARGAAPLSTSGKAGVSAAPAGKSRASGKGFPGSRRRHQDDDAHGRLSVRQRKGLTLSSTERGKEHGAGRGRAGENEGSGTGSEEQGDEQDDSDEKSGGEGEEEEEEEEDQSVALDMEGLVADLRAREGEALSRMEELRSQAKALAEEEQWLATGSLGKGHAWEAVSRLGGDNENYLLGEGTNRRTDVHGLGLEADRRNLEVVNRAMEEEARLARKETELLSAASTILGEHVNEEIEVVHASLTSASDVALDMVGAAVAASSYAAAAAARSRWEGGNSSTSVVQASREQRDGPVQDLLCSAFRELASMCKSKKAAWKPAGNVAVGGPSAEERGGGGGGPISTGPTGARVGDAVVLRLKDIQVYRPPRHADYPAGEQFYLRHTSVEKFSVAVPKGDGFVTVIAMGPPAKCATNDVYSAATPFAPSGVATNPASRGTFLLAAGTSKGGIAVWAVPTLEEETSAGGVDKRSGKNSKNFKNNSAAVIIRVASAASMSKDERCPVEKVHFGADGRSQLVSLDAQRVVKVWDIDGRRDAAAAEAAQGHQGRGTKAAAREFLPELRGSGGAFSKFQALPLVARWAIRHGDLERPLLDAATASWLDSTGNTGAAADTKDKKRGLLRGRGRGEDAGTASASTLPSVGGSSETPSATTAGKADGGSWSSSMKRDMHATTVAFHTAMTAFGEQLSVVVATAGGSLVKCNADAWPVAVAAGGEGGDGGRDGDVAYGRCLVPIEPGNRGAPHEATVLRSTASADGEGSGGMLGGCNSVRREFFERHRHSVIFVGFKDHVSLTMVTLDVSGLLCVWPYSADAFSGFGWYTPSKEVVVDVTLHSYKLETNRAARRGERGTGSGGGGGGGFIFNRALPPDYSETANPREALAELRTGGGYRLSSTERTVGRGRAETYIGPPDSGSDSRGGAAVFRAIVARYDEEGELKSATRLRAVEGAREGMITDAKLTVSGGELAVVASYRPLAPAAGCGPGAGGSSPTGRGDGTSGSEEVPQFTAMVFLVNLESTQLLPQHVRHDWPMTSGGTGGFPSPAFAVSPVLDATGSDYVYLAIEDSIRIFSLETGFEVTLQEGRRLSTKIGGGPGDGGTRGGNGAAAATASTGPTVPIVAAEVASDNGTLAVACADSAGAVTLFRFRDNSLKVAMAEKRRTAPGSRSRGRSSDSDRSSDSGSGRGSGTPTMSWRRLLRTFECDRRDATPWEMRVHLSTPFAMASDEGFSHRDQIRRVIVSDIVEAAIALSEQNQTAKKLRIEPIEGTGGQSSAPVGLGAGGRVSLRDLLGKPPYGTV
ncbi:unnamed protein product [Ectocarpus sp. 12 AP-2014]